MRTLYFCATIFATIFGATSLMADGHGLTIELLNKREDGSKMVYSQDIARI
jgi:hypothetical protein